MANLREVLRTAYATQAPRELELSRIDSVGQYDSQLRWIDRKGFNSLFSYLSSNGLEVYIDRRYCLGDFIGGPYIPVVATSKDDSLVRVLDDLEFDGRDFGFLRTSGVVFSISRNTNNSSRDTFQVQHAPLLLLGPFELARFDLDLVTQREFESYKPLIEK